MNIAIIWTACNKLKSSNKISLQLYLDAQNSNTARELKIAIIGAGATGVELCRRT